MSRSGNAAGDQKPVGRATECISPAPTADVAELPAKKRRRTCLFCEDNQILDSQLATHRRSCVHEITYPTPLVQQMQMHGMRTMEQYSCFKGIREHKAVAYVGGLSANMVVALGNLIEVGKLFWPAQGCRQQHQGVLYSIGYWKRWQKPYSGTEEEALCETALLFWQKLLEESAVAKHVIQHADWEYRADLQAMVRQLVEIAHPSTPHVYVGVDYSP